MQSKRAERSSKDNIREILECDAGMSRIEEIYDRWAADYDPDLRRRNYSAPASLLDCLLRMPRSNGGIDTTDIYIEILDAGCGTGLMGKLLHDAGYREIDGCDLSAKMIEKAQRTGVYQQLFPKIDLTRRNEAIPGNRYALTVCCGVFAGPMPPEGLHELLRVTRTGGIILISTRRDYCKKTNFRSLVGELCHGDRIRVESLVTGAPYIDNETGDFWTLLKLC